LPEADRTENATPRKRHKAREQGQVARTRELAPALALTTAVMCLSWLVARWPREWHELFSTLLTASMGNSDGVSVVAIRKTALLAFRWAGPPVALGFLVALAASLAQGGFVLAPKALTFKPEKLSPASNFQRLLSVDSIRRVLKSCIPTAILVYMAVTILASNWDQVRSLSFAPAKASFTYLLGLMFELMWKGSLVFAIWSAADFLFEKFNFERQLRMSKQEIREESKETEGNPAIRGRIRRLQRQMRKRRMIRDTSQATVVVTNPTHFAVALRYLPEEMDAPVVVAKGQNLLAQMIRQQAVWHGVPIVENPPLAQALYRTVEVGQAIPAKLYAAVAEILAFIYRMQAKERRTRLAAGKSTYAQV
jgi:flagellar biosynthetic protein FlhB